MVSNIFQNYAYYFIGIFVSSFYTTVQKAIEGRISLAHLYTLHIDRAW